MIQKSKRYAKSARIEPEAKTTHREYKMGWRDAMIVVNFKISLLKPQPRETAIQYQARLLNSFDETPPEYKR